MSGKTLEGTPAGEELLEAYTEIEEEEDEHLYHSLGWCRELWLESLGLEAMLPPPEQTADATSASEAEEAQRSAHPH